MNRYALAGAAALLFLIALSGAGGLSPLFRGNTETSQGGQPEATTLGTLPIEKAGQVVQRQGSAPGAPMAPAMTPNGAINGDTPPTSANAFTTPTGTPSTLSGSPQNPIPPAVGATPSPAQVGDNSSVPPELLPPDPQPPATHDRDMEAIPALW
jgi:hypothetical protein